MKVNQFDMEYLGDGVYCGHDGHQVWLTTGSHENQELVALDPQVLRNLMRYADSKLPNFEITG